eukprot:TRINITY_DN9068_c0_g1_i1.p1 TRINITY_DN9068_c0_g1~~TRINITY_DN9068_c0_g1_i1.p1  ORF type:complete len:659 (+),score=155.60 TRINITY_DN9068_c0_g1_i1:149-2125(+)
MGAGCSASAQQVKGSANPSKNEEKEKAEEEAQPPENRVEVERDDEKEKEKEKTAAEETKPLENRVEDERDEEKEKKTEEEEQPIENGVEEERDDKEKENKNKAGEETKLQENAVEEREKTKDAKKDMRKLFASSGDLTVYRTGVEQEPERGGYQPYTRTETYDILVKDETLDLTLVSKKTICRDCEDFDTSYELQVGDIFFFLEDECGRNFRDQKVDIQRQGKSIASWTLSQARGGMRLANAYTEASGIYSGVAAIADIAKACKMVPLRDVLKCLVRLQGADPLSVFLKEDLLELASLMCSELSVDSDGSIKSEESCTLVDVHGVQFPRKVTKHGGNRNVSSELCGISCLQFYQFVNSCKRTLKWKTIEETPGFGGKVGWVNGYEICEDFVKPYTRGTGSGVSLTLNEEMPLRADVMLSHSWAESMDEVQVALLSLPGLKTETALWFCIFANYQCGGEEGDVGPTIQEQLEQDPFGRVIRQKSLMGMVVIQTSTAEVYERLWCVYEIAEALKSGVNVCCVTSNRDTSKKLKQAEANTQAAQCSRVEDERMIRSQILEHGGFEQLDKTIDEFRQKEEKKGSEARRLILGYENVGDNGPPKAPEKDGRDQSVHDLGDLGADLNTILAFNDISKHPDILRLAEAQNCSVEELLGEIMGEPT